MTAEPTRDSIASNNGLTPFMPVNPTDDPLQQITQNQDLVLYNEGCKELQVSITFFFPNQEIARPRKSCKSCKVVILEKVAKECDTSLYGMHRVACEPMANSLMICRKENSERKSCCNCFETAPKLHANTKKHRREPT